MYNLPGLKTIPKLFGGDFKPNVKCANLLKTLKS